MNFIINLEFIYKVIRIKNIAIKGITSSDEVSKVKLEV